MQPMASRAGLPTEYGLPRDSKNFLPWSHVNDHLAAAKHYWLATVAPGGRPHVRPVDGMWLDGKLYFGGSTSARWLRNLSANPQASINLEDAEHAVIIDGDVRATRPGRELAERLARASNDKYHQNQNVEDYEGVELAEFSPRLALAWKVLYEDATQWRFE